MKFRSRPEVRVPIDMEEQEKAVFLEKELVVRLGIGISVGDSILLARFYRPEFDRQIVKFFYIASLLPSARFFSKRMYSNLLCRIAGKMC